MLTITGEVLAVKTERVEWSGGAPFDSTDIKMLSGEGESTSIDYVRVGKGFDRAALPKQGDRVSLEVFASGYRNEKTGVVRVQLTAVRVARPAGLRAATA